MQTFFTILIRLSLILGLLSFYSTKRFFISQNSLVGIIILFVIAVIFTPLFARFIVSFLSIKPVFGSQVKKAKISEEFFQITFLVAGHIAGSDGVACNKELSQLARVIRNFKLNSAETVLAEKYFRQGQAYSFSLVDNINYLNNILKDSNKSSGLAHNFLQIQFTIAFADKEISNSEYEILEYITIKLGFTKEFQHLLREYKAKTEKYRTHKQRKEDSKKEEEKSKKSNQKYNYNQKTAKSSIFTNEIMIALSVLDLSETEANKTNIKKAYRKKIKQNHPDTLLAKGYPKQLIEEANRRSAEINKSYALLKKYFKFK